MNKVSRILGSTVLATGLALGGGALTAGAASANDNGGGYGSHSDHNRGGNWDHDRYCKKGHHHYWKEWNRHSHRWDRHYKCDDDKRNYRSYVVNY
jgi:hypothetical protein